LLEDVPGLTRRALARVFDTEMGLHAACRQGVIGLRVLQPKGLRSYMEKGRVPQAPAPDDDKFITYKMYMRWIMAMLNSKELGDYAKEVADTLHGAAKGKRGLTRSSQEVKAVLQSTTRRNFIDGLTKLVETNRDSAPAFVALVDRVLQLPAANFPLFITLLRFYYAAEQD
jgi:hypothetical protein